MQITPARKWKVHEGNESIITQKYFIVKKEKLGCTVIDLVMKIKPFKGVNTKAWHFLLQKN